MSWAEEDWTVGLSGRTLQKVKELQVQQERLNRERQQKQLQLDSTQTSLNKQTVKYEEVRGELQCVQRELQGAREEVQAGVCARERLSQDLQVKQAQVCSLEGQLGSARTLTHTLEKEVKRLEAELEKLQTTSSSGDSMLFSTPCWNMTSPRDHNGGRQEDRQGQSEEGDNKSLHVRQHLKFAEPAFSPTPMFPQQQAKGTPHRRLSHQSDSSTPSAVFPWEREDPKPYARGRPTPPPSLPSSSDVIRRGQEAGDCGMVDDLRRETDMSGCVAELQGRMRALQGELKAECERFRQTQDALANARRDLTTREQSLQRAKDELSLAHTRISQESDRAQSLEQRVKQLQEELKCQRQNTESSRLQHQQRTRDLDKQHQRDLLELQKECQSVEKQHQLDVNKLNQEVQQARTLHNTLQAQSEKVSLQKQALERDVDALKEKVKWTEGELKESQKKESQTQDKLTESVREREGLNVTLEQNRRREKIVEEEVKKLTEELAEALRRITELEDQKTVQPSAAPMAPVPFSPAGQSFALVSPPRHGRPTPHTPSAQTNRPAREERAREEEERGNEERRAKYPTEREPGEGIDSEHITAFGSTDSEKRQRAGERGSGEERKRENERKEEAESVVDGCIPGKETSTKDKNALNTPSSLSPTDQSPHLTSSASSDTDYESETLSSHSKPRAQTTRAEGDLQRENRELRSELQDVKDELQRRLEDLETQRRAEAEARTRLKQLSRKHASQAETTRETEEERVEMGRLKEALAELEIKVRRDAEERKEREREDRESESMLLNLQLKKQLAELKTELLIEQEERERGKEERKRLKNKGTEGTIDLTVKLEELLAELEELKNRECLEVKNVVDKNTPLTYLTLHQDINSNSNNNKLLPSPDQHHLLCESTTVSQATTADLIREEGTLTKAPELSKPIGEGETIVEAQRSVSASELGETTVEAEKGISSSDQGETSDMEKTPVELQSGGLSASELAQEVERLRGESAREAGRAMHTQAKLEALQSQVTRQTQQLTLAFDHQSRHIQDLLAELQEKEGRLLRQGQELQRCRDELATLREERERPERETEKREEERQKEELEEGRATITPQQADHNTDIHQITNSTQNESASGIEESTDITMKPLNTTQASSTLCDEGGQLTTPQKNGVTESHDVTDSTTTLGSHPAEHNTEKMVDSKASAQPGRSEETKNKEKFISDNLTVVCSKEQMEQSESSEMKHIRSEEQHSTKDSPAFKRGTEELQLSQRDLSTENTHLTAELEKASGPISRPEDTSGQERKDSGGESLAEELQSLKQKNQLLKLKLQDVANTDGETSSVSNTTLAASCGDQAERKAKGRKRKNQRGGQEVISTSGELEHVSDITSGREATLQDGGKPIDKERGGVESEGEWETEAGDEGRGGVVALQAELQSLSEENQRQAEELALWRLMVQPPCLDPEDPTAATLSPGHNTATLSPATLSPGHNTATLSPATLSPGHNTATLSPGQHNSVTVIREDELLLSCTSSRLYGRTLASRLHHCNSNEAKSLQNSSRKTKSTHHQETEKLTNEHREDGRDEEADVPQTSELQTKATEHANQDHPENKTNPNTPRATDETQTKEIVSRHNLDVIELDNLIEFPTLSLAEAQSTESQSSEINHPSHHQEEPISTGVENKNHSSVRRKVTTTTTTSEWQTERTIVETKVLSSKVIPAGWTGQERLTSVEVRSTSSQTEEGGATGVWTPTQPPTPATLPETHHVYTQTEEEEEEENDEEPTESPPVSPVQMSEAEGDRILFSGSFPIPADPARLAERIRRNRTQMSAAYDDTEYEPYGLPEVVMKGFADIPSGLACPYIVRRGLLGTAAMPRPRRDSGQTFFVQIHWKTVTEEKEFISQDLLSTDPHLLTS
ncbi:centromere protein F [Coregonus clupeaformis]|uniref:centromere protein F n=1 Tax=Coregonus clupeaformis TaxID=59861 RepID=UPI001BDFEEAC|nr:centromere protein F [Coregonus clupeaformis]